MYKTFREQQMEIDVQRNILNPKLNPGQAQQLLDLGASEEEIALTYMNSGVLTRMNNNHAAEIVKNYPEILSTISQKPFDSISVDYLDDLANKAQLNRNFSELPEYEDDLLEYYTNATKRSYYTLNANYLKGRASNPNVEVDKTNSLLEKSQMYSRRAANVRGQIPTTFVQKTLDFTGSLTGTTGEFLGLSIAATKAGALSGGTIAGVPGAAIGGAAGFTGGLAHAFSKMFFASQGENIERLREVNPELNITDAYDKAKLTSIAQSGVEQIDLIFGLGLSGLVRKAGTKVVLGVGGLAKAGAKGVFGELILEEGTQQLLGDTLIDTETGDLSFGVTFLQNLGGDIENLFSGEPLNQRNKQILDMLKYGSPVLFAGGVIGQVYQNKTEWTKKRDGDPITQEYNNNRLKTQLNNIQTQSKESNLVNSPQLEKAINSNLFRQPVAISVENWNTLKENGLQRLEGKTLEEFGIWFAAVEKNIDLETLNETNEDITLPAAEYLAGIGIEDELLQEGMQYIKSNENYLSESDKKLVDYVNLDKQLERKSSEWSAIEDIISNKIERNENLSGNEKNILATSSAMRVAGAKRALKDGADLDVEKFFEEQGFDINVVKNVPLTEEQRTSKQSEIEGALIIKARDEGKLEGISGTNIDTIIKNTKDKVAKKQLKQIRKDAKKVQQTQEGKLGSFNQESKVISLFSGNNITTLFHEVEHWYDDFMQTAYFNNTLNDDSRRTFEGVRNHFGLEENERFSKQNLEDLAEMNEEYMINGSAPTFALKKFFETIKNIMLDTYGLISKRGIKVNPKIKEYFDLQYVTREELKVARENDRLIARGDIESDYYKDQVEKAEILEHNIVYKNHQKRNKRENSKEIESFRKKEFDLAIKDLSTEPVYKAQKAIVSQGKLDSKNIKDTDYNISSIDEKYIKQGGSIGFNKDADIEILATSVGFVDATSMLDSLSRSTTIEQAATQKSSLAVQERLDREFGEDISDIPYKALRNDNRLNVLVTEAVWGENITVAEIKDFKNNLIDKAKNLLDTMSIERVSNVEKNRNNETKNSDLALRAFINDNEKASSFFELAALNHIIAQEGYNAQEQLKAFNKLTQNKMKSSNIINDLGQDNYNTIASILNNFTFEYEVTGTTGLEERLDSWIDKNKEGTSLDVNVIKQNKDFLLTGAKDLSEMKYFDFNLLSEITNSVLTQSELINKRQGSNLEAGTKVFYDKIMKDLRSKKGKVKKVTSNSNIVIKADFKATTGVESSMFEFLGKDFQLDLASPLFRDLAAANDIGGKRADAYTVLLKDNDMFRLNTVKNKSIPSLNIKLSDAEIFQVACQWGTIESRNETLKKIENMSENPDLIIARQQGNNKGLKLTPEQISEVESIIPLKYMEMAEKSWKFLKEDLPATKKTYSKINNSAMSEVDGVEFNFKEKKFQGGYYPMFRERIGASEAVNETFSMRMSRVLLNANHTKERTGIIEGNIDLAGDRIFQHIHNVQIYINSAESYQSMGEFFNANGNEISSIVGDVRFKTWRDWHNEIFDSTGENDIVNFIDKYSKFVAIAFKAKTALVQPTALLNAIPYVGARNLAVASSKVLTNPKRLTPNGAVAAVNHPTFTGRAKDGLRTIAGVQDELKGKSTASKVGDQIFELGFAGVGYTDAVLTAQIAFEAGRMKGKQMGLSDAQAADWGASMMRITQVDASKFSKPKLLKGLARPLYPFMTYFMGIKTNVMEKWSAGDKIGSSILAFNFLITAAAIEAMIEASINGLVEDEDDEEGGFINQWKKNMWRNVTGNMVSITPLVGIPGAGTGALNASTGSTFKGSTPALSSVTDTGVFLHNVYQTGRSSLGFESDKDTDEWVAKTINSGLSFVPNKKMVKLLIENLTDE